MTASSTIDRDELAWLHALARALVSTGESPEDLAQETALRSLELERPDGAPARPWLASVMRGLRSNRRRSDRRRSGREERHEASFEAPSTEALVSRAETAEALSAAARDLPEPQRRTVLLHFLEGLSVQEIARREQKPADTIRWRLRKGLELLRARLVERSGQDWRWWTAALAPLARPLSPAAPAAHAAAGSVLLLTVMKWSALALAVLAIALTLVLSPFSESTPNTDLELDLGGAAPVLPGESAQPDAPPADLVAVSGEGTRDTGRRAAEEPATDPLDDAGQSPMHGIVVDETGAGISGATLSLTVTGETYSPADREGVPQTTSGSDGRFDFGSIALAGPLAAAVEPMTLNVHANGYRRTSLANALVELPADGWRIVLDRGASLGGRVVDLEGRPVSGLQLAAFRAEMGIDHMSTSRRRRRVLFNRLVAGEDDHLCTRTTREDGTVLFEGLGEGDQSILSLDPAWRIEAPIYAKAGSTNVVWTARPCLGVVVELHHGDGTAVAASAKFKVEVSDAEGELHDYGEWLGRGDGEVSMTLKPGDLPFEPTTARFYGTVTVGGRSVGWSADTLETLPGVARARVDLRDLLPEEDEEEEVEPEPFPMRKVVLDVRRADGTFVEADTVYYEWVDPKSGRYDGTRAPAGAGPGRFVAELPQRAVRLEVTEPNAQGSVAPWTGTVPADQSGVVLVTLAPAGSITIVKPAGLVGVWKVRLQRSDSPDGPWRGGWNYGTPEDRLVLSAVDQGYWWIRIAQREQFDDPVQEYVVEIEGCSDIVVGD